MATHREYLRWERRSEGPHRVLMLTTAWPSPDEPVRGIFVKRQVDELTKQGIAIDVLGICGHTSIKSYLAAARELRWGSAARSEYRLIHAQSGEAAAVAWVRRDIPLVITYFGSDILGRRDSAGSLPWQSRVRSGALRLTAGPATATITQSDEMHRCLPARFAYRDQVLLNGVDLERFAPRERINARAELGWAAGRVALFVAAQPKTPLKRLWLAEDAVSLAKADYPDLRLEVISGASPERMPLIMAAADCLIHPSASEGSPNVVKEAMACNLPIVATPVGDIRSLLEDVEGCFVCDPTPTSLAEGIGGCLLAGRSNGREHAAQFDQRRITRELIKLYDTLAPA